MQSEKARFPISMWNHWNNNDERTNKRVEGDNHKMKQYCGAADPKIDKAISHLRDYETATKDKYFSAKKENAKAPYQRIDDP